MPYIGSEPRFILDFKGSYGPKYRVYENITGRTEDFRRLTPEGFPHIRQIAYFEAITPWVMWAGQRGSGKTFGAVWDNLFTAYLVPGSQQIVFRRTMSELRRTIIAEFLKLPPELRGNFTDSQTTPRLVLPNGSSIHFASINDETAARKYLSGEFLKVTIDEIAEIPFEWTLFVSGSARCTITHDILGRPLTSQIKGLTNPGGQAADTLRHLFGADCEKSCPKHLDMVYNPEDFTFIPSLMSDNPAYAEDTPAGKAYRRMLSMQPKAIREAWLYGRWTGFEGMYFDCFEKDMVAIPHDDVLRLMKKQYWQPIFMGIDWGQVHHAYINWNTVLDFTDSRGKVRTIPVTLGELLLKGLSERALAEEIVDRTRVLFGEPGIAKISKVYLSPETFGTSPRSRARIIGDVFASHGMVRPLPAKTEKNSRQNGLRLMYTLLAERIELLSAPWAPKNTVPGWLIDDSCTDLLGALPWAVSDKDKDGDIKAEGSNYYLDVLDGERYAIYSNYSSHDQPATDIYKEKMERLTQGGINPSRSLTLFVEHCKRMRELKETSGKTSRIANYAKSRHPRMGRRGSQDDTDMLKRFTP